MIEIGAIREGDLYKVLTVEGKRFEIYYGYYDERERYSKYCDPIPIYPDFLKDPEFTEGGSPYVTGMQDTCEYYIGRDQSGCHGCKYFKSYDDLIGICSCEKRRPV